MTRGRIVADGFERFRQVLDDYRSLSLWAAGGAAAIPFVAQFIGVAPPFPDGVAPITAILQLVALAITFHFVSQRSRAFVNKLIIRAALAIALLMIAYLILFSSLVILMDPDRNIALVRGFVCTAEASFLYGQECPFLSKETLALALFQEEDLWTFGSLIAARLVLFFVWLGFFLAVSVFFAAFITYQRKK
jgi:hypothetical protein